MEIVTLSNLATLALLTLLQAVLGFDNLLYVSLESKRAPVDQQAMVRKLGIGIAVILRILLLFVVLQVIRFFQKPLFGLHWVNVLEGAFNLHSLIVLAGGGFIIYTATKEILHMMAIQDLHAQERKQKSTGLVITSIVLMNIVFSFDSILSAMALTDVFAVMASVSVSNFALDGSGIVLL